MEPCLNFISDPKKMSIAVSNSGSEQKVFNVLKGSTGVDEVVDNTQQVNSIVEIEVATVESRPEVLPLLIESENLLAFLSVTFRTLTLFDTSTNTIKAAVVLNLMTVTSQAQLYYSNGYVYIFGGNTRQLVRVNTNNFSYVNLFISGAGPLGLGCVDVLRNRLYITSKFDNILIVYNTITHIIDSTVDLSAYGSGIGLFNCLLGQNYLGCIVGADIVMLNPVPSVPIVHNSFIGALTDGLDIAYASGTFGFACSSTITFVKESTMDLITNTLGNGSAWFSKNHKQDRFVFIPELGDGGYLEIDFLNYTSSSVITGTVSFVTPSLPLYNPYSDTVIIENPTSPTGGTIKLIGSDSTQELVITSTLITNGASSSSTGKTYYAPGKDNFFPKVSVIATTVSNQVTMIYNGGNTSTESIDQSLIGTPIKVLHMKIISSSMQQLLNLLTKSRNDSAGTINSFQIKNIVNFDASSEQYVVDFTGDELYDSVFDGQTLLQGLINGNSSMSFEIDYMEYDQSRVVSSTDCAPQEPKKKKVCYFHNRRLL